MMRRMMLLGAVLLATSSCGKDAPAPRTWTFESSGPPPTRDQLWGLAPLRADAGVVVTSVAIDELVTLVAQVRAGLRDAPYPAALAWLADTLSVAGIDLLDPSAAEAAGVNLSLGLAVFSDGEDVVLAVAVADAARFQRAMTAARQRCRESAGMALCATSIPGQTMPELMRDDAARALAGARGEIELLARDGEIELAASVRVARGELEATARIRGLWAPLPPPRRSPLLDQLGDAAHSGVVVADLAGLRPRLEAALPIATAPALGQLLTALRGDVVGVTNPGRAGEHSTRFGVDDPATLRDLLEACTPLDVPGLLRAVPGDDGCVLQGLGIGAAGRTHIEGDTLVSESHAAVARPAAAATAAPAPPAALAGPWTVLAWGHGHGAVAPLAMRADLHEPRLVQLIVWAAAHLDDLAIGVRPAADGRFELWLRVGTIWRHSDAVIAALSPVLAAAARAEDVTADLAAIAAREPAFAEAHAMGGGGLSAAVGVVSLLVTAYVLFEVPPG